ncbi:helix-turn-helix domain-containing protein [Lactobacillus sp. DCY120]|uniref:Helix-turn-helix domain-containing protein n=1 Tax=Bombilactobacillus apium TaxID=2675299 RepID=A0A850R671_9LACO|nr:helix-turn-helix domain-containing protein [Bombilactobacillus apium]NVY96132.1 helix-turn-helix domain-containing protein [Bombilactobacillus apium]
MNAKQLPSNQIRKYQILARLLQGEHLSYQRLATDYYVGRSSIAHDIVFIKSELAQDQLSLTYDNSGTYLAGEELETQKIINRIVMKILAHPPLQSLLTWYLDPKLLQKVRAILSKKIKTWDLEVPENLLNDLIISTAILLDRGQQGYPLDLPTGAPTTSSLTN